MGHVFPCWSGLLVEKVSLGTISVTTMFPNSPQSTAVAGWEVSLEAVQLQVGVVLFVYFKPSFSTLLFLKA